MYIPEETSLKPDKPCAITRQMLLSWNSKSGRAKILKRLLWEKIIKLIFRTYLLTCLDGVICRNKNTAEHNIGHAM